MLPLASARAEEVASVLNETLATSLSAVELERLAPAPSAVSARFATRHPDYTAGGRCTDVQSFSLYLGWPEPGSPFLLGMDRGHLPLDAAIEGRLAAARAGLAALFARWLAEETELAASLATPVAASPRSRLSPLAT